MVHAHGMHSKPLLKNYNHIIKYNRKSRKGEAGMWSKAHTSKCTRTSKKSV